MSVNIELPQLITILLFIVGCAISLSKYLLDQISKNISKLEDQNKAEAEGWKQLERDLMTLRADLPLHYVRREDYVRGQTVIEAKLDALYNKLEAVSIRAAKEKA